MEKSSRLVCTWNSDERSELDNALGSCRYTIYVADEDRADATAQGECTGCDES